jgi:rhodanese-related sulfurtransferase
MMRVSSAILLSVALLATILLTGCNSAEKKAKAAAPANPAAAQPANAPTDDVRRISIADAKAEFERGKAIIIDVRGEAVYKLGHIKGAKLIGFTEIASRFAELPKDKTIVLYCSCPAEHSSVAAAQQLKTKGVENTAALVGGYNAWKAAGFPVEEEK